MRQSGIIPIDSFLNELSWPEDNIPTNFFNDSAGAQAMKAEKI